MLRFLIPTISTLNSLLLDDTLKPVSDKPSEVGMFTYITINKYKMLCTSLTEFPGAYCGFLCWFAMHCV